MAKPFQPQIKKLQRAINDKYDKKILVSKSQFYSNDAQRPLEYYIIAQAVWDEDKLKYRNEELFSSASDIQIVKWLRDYWYTLNGWEVPTDDPVWEEAKEAYKRKQEAKRLKK